MDRIAELGPIRSRIEDLEQVVAGSCWSKKGYNHEFLERVDRKSNITSRLLEIINRLRNSGLANLVPLEVPPNDEVVDEQMAVLSGRMSSIHRVCAQLEYVESCQPFVNSSKVTELCNLKRLAMDFHDEIQEETAELRRFEADLDGFLASYCLVVRSVSEAFMEIDERVRLLEIEEGIGGELSQNGS